MEKVFEVREKQGKYNGVFFQGMALYPSSSKEIYLCHKDKCDRFKVINNDVIVENIVELTCDHEEADTRIAVHASGECNSIIIASPDTDVFVIMLHVSTSCSSSIYFLTGTGVKRRIIPVTTVGQKLGPRLCKALIGFHAFTGRSFGINLLAKHNSSFFQQAKQLEGG